MIEQDFLKEASLAGLLAAFANAKHHENGYIIESSYKNSSYAPYELEPSIYSQNNQLLCFYTGLRFQLNKSKHQFLIESKSENDDFFEKLYRRIQQKRFEENINNDEFERTMILSFFALRGSLDFTRNFYSLDLLRTVVTPKYLDNLFNLLTNLSDLRQLNLNFRELQEEFVSGENQRNTQFRVNLRYFYELVGKELAQVNKYKYDILEHKKLLVTTKSIAQNEDNCFVQRILFYTNKVLKKQKTEREIEQLRKELGFEYDTKIDNKVKRNQGIVQYVRVYFPDECAACKQQYHIADRSFKYRNSERYYMEVHHCISFSADNTCDQIDNLVKLCPTCHRALTKNRADETYQRELITRIFDNAPETKSFCLNFVEHENQLVDFVYERLR